MLAFTGSLIEPTPELLYESEVMKLLRVARASFAGKSERLPSALTAFKTYLEYRNEQNRRGDIDGNLQSSSFSLFNQPLKPESIGIPAWNFLFKTAIRECEIIYTEKPFDELLISDLKNKISDPTLVVINLDEKLARYSTDGLKRLNLDCLTMRSGQFVLFLCEFLSLLHGCSLKG